MLEPQSDKKTILPVHCPIYSDEIAVLMARCADIAYHTSKEEIEVKLRNLQLEYVNFSSGEPQFIIAEHREFYIVAFRGTKGISDIFSNLLFISMKTKMGKLHKLYTNNYCEIHNQLTEFLDKALKKEKKPVYITGHSRGGALAIIAASQLFKQNVAACYTFGSPPISEDRLDCFIEKPIYRVGNEGDIIPLLLKFKYEHIGSFYFLTKDGCALRSPYIGFSKTSKILFKKLNIKLQMFFKNKDISYPEHDIKTYIKKLKKVAENRKRMKSKKKMICTT